MRKTHQLRRTVITRVLLGGGDPVLAAGHADGRTTRLHYLDPRMTSQRTADFTNYRPLEKIAAAGKAVLLLESDTSG